MYFNDHDPPHSHVRYGEHRATFSIGELRVLDGELPRRGSALVLEWAFERRHELERDWQLARAGAPLEPIAPLV